MRGPPHEDNRLAALLLAIGVIMALLWLWVVLKATAFAAPAAPRDRDATATIPGYSVGEFVEPPVVILTTLHGQKVVTLQHLLHQWPDLIVPVEALKLVNPGARQTILGVRLGNTAYRTALKIPRNSLYYRNSKIACAAFVSAMFRKNGVGGYSYSVSAMYKQMRSRKNKSGRGGGKLVASQTSTRYTPFFKWFKAGDVLYFHKGNRLGHVEVYCGRGLTAGTSSSSGRVAVRKTGNRGFARMSVVRL